MYSYMVIYSGCLAGVEKTRGDKQINSENKEINSENKEINFEHEKSMEIISIHLCTYVNDHFYSQAEVKVTGKKSGIWKAKSASQLPMALR